MMKSAATLVLLLLAACAGETGNEFTLYRSGIDIPTQKHDETLRIHVATFDAESDAQYNRTNCEFARDLFTSNQPHFRDYRSTMVAPGSMRFNYWCEKGRFRK